MGAHPCASVINQHHNYIYILATTVNRTQGLKIFSLALSQLSYRSLNLVSHSLYYTKNHTHTTIHTYTHITITIHTHTNYTPLKYTKIFKTIIAYQYYFLITTNALSFTKLNTIQWIHTSNNFYLRTYINLDILQSLQNGPTGIH